MLANDSSDAAGVAAPQNGNGWIGLFCLSAPMWSGNYQRWNPLPGLAGARVYCKAVHDDWEGFRIWLWPEDIGPGIIVVRFESQLFYANSGEGDRLGPVANQEEIQLPQAFWIVQGSDLVAEFRRQAAGVRDDDDLVHYAFLTCNDCIDVIAAEAPIFAGVGVGGHANT